MIHTEYSDRFELDKALARFCGDKELLGEAIAIYKEEAKKHLETISELIQAGEVTKISIHAHTLKGESGAVGATAAQHACENLEKAAEHNKYDQIKDLYGRVIEETTIALDFLPDLIE